MFLVRCVVGMRCLISDIVMIMVGVKNVLVSRRVVDNVGMFFVSSSGEVVVVVVMLLSSSRWCSGMCYVIVLNSRLVVYELVV